MTADNYELGNVEKSDQDRSGALVNTNHVCAKLTNNNFHIFPFEIATGEVDATVVPGGRRFDIWHVCAGRLQHRRDQCARGARARMVQPDGVREVRR